MVSEPASEPAPRGPALPSNPAVPPGNLSAPTPSLHGLPAVLGTALTVSTPRHVPLSIASTANCHTVSAQLCSRSIGSACSLLAGWPYYCAQCRVHREAFYDPAFWGVEAQQNEVGASTDGALGASAADATDVPTAAASSSTPVNDRIATDELGAERSSPCERCVQCYEWYVRAVRNAISRA